MAPTGGPPIGSKTALIISLMVLSLFGYGAYSQVRFQQLSEGLDADIATYRRQLWERPVLRGTARSNNAALAAAAALPAVGNLTEEQREKLAELLHFGQPLDETLTKLVQARREAIDRWLSSTQNNFAMNELPLEQGADIGVPNYPLVMDASLLALAAAGASAPGDCLTLAADVIRAGQDLVPGGPLEAASVAARIISVANPVVSRCASLANEKDVRRAFREFHSLSTHPPPTGSSIEMADILTAVEVREQTTMSPRRRGTSALERIRRRPGLFKTWAFYEDPTRWRNITPDRYPAALEEWRTEHEWRSQSELQGVAAATSGTLGWLYDDMRGQALLRSLTLGISTLAERMRHKKIPDEPTRLKVKALYDPFVGRPLNWRISPEGKELTIWSVGENLRNDLATDGWAPDAPLDVVVRMKIYPLKSR